MAMTTQRRLRQGMRGWVRLWMRLFVRSAVVVIAVIFCRAVLGSSSPSEMLRGVLAARADPGSVAVAAVLVGRYDGYGDITVYIVHINCRGHNIQLRLM